MKSKRSLSCAASMLLLAATSMAKQEIKGAHATAAYSEGKATFTIFNNSPRGIKAWAVSTTVQFADGHRSDGGHVEEYGPLLNGRVLHPGESVEFTSTDYPTGVVSVEAKVTAALYDDNTAEATDGMRIDRMISDRKNLLYTVTLLSDTLREAAIDKHPVLKAKSDLKLLLASTEKGISKALVEGAITNLDNMKGSHERESVQQYASDFQRMAKTYAGFADILRLP